MPYPQFVSNTQEKGKRMPATAVPGKYVAKTKKGSTKPPLKPTGRLVTEDSSAITHWLPDANKTGEYSWKCPECARWFHWSVDRQQWEPASSAAA